MAYSDTPTYSEKRAAKEFFNSMAHLLPCPVCREHFTEVLQGLPVETWLDNRKSLTEWVWMVHNRVNVKLGKPEVTMAAFHEKYREMSRRGLPVPPSNPTAEIADATVNDAYIRGATHAVGGLIAIGIVGGLLWASYNNK